MTTNPSPVADPTGTNASRNSRRESNSDLAVNGGPEYTARLEEIEEAFARLNIGQNAQAAFNQAQRKLAEADAGAHALRNQAARTLAEAQTKAEAQAASADQIVANAKAQQKEVDERLKQVEAREQATIAAYAKAERAEADANRLRDGLQGAIDYFRTRVREIAAA
jgi:DNA repair exonuclease SbcCD ATPase subunit